MRDGWESQARNWARFARTPGHDSPHEEINLPALLRLLPPPNGLALEAYGQALEEAGLLIEAIREPRAPGGLRCPPAKPAPLAAHPHVASPARDQAVALRPNAYPP
jgi:hypothetical protein